VSFWVYHDEKILPSGGQSRGQLHKLQRLVLQVSHHVFSSLRLFLNQLHKYLYDQLAGSRGEISVNF